MLPDRKASGASSVLSLSAARKVDRRASASGTAQGSLEVIGAAGARVLAQDQARPVERAGEDPGRLRARALGRLDLHRAPLLPDHRAGERGDQRDDDHRRQQRRAALCVRGRTRGAAAWHRSWPEHRVAGQVAARAAARAKLEHQAHAGGQRLRGRCVTPRLAPARAAAGARSPASTGVAPGVAPVEVDLPLRQAVSARTWPGSVPCNCWLRSQLSCSSPRGRDAPGRPSAASAAVARRAQRPGDDLQRRRARGASGAARAVEAQRPARTAVSCIEARSCLPLRHHGVQAQRLLEPAPGCVARAHDAVHALPGHRGHDRHDQQRHQHLDQREARASCAACGISSARSTVDRVRIGWPAVVVRPAHRRAGNCGFGVGRDRPACRCRSGRAARSRIRRRRRRGTAGPGCRPVSWLSAHHCAALTSARRWVLSVSAPAALMPAPSVMATMASATSTSISVKPRARCDVISAAAPAPRRLTTNGPRPSVASVEPAASSRRSTMRCAPISGSGPSITARAPTTSALTPGSASGWAARSTPAGRRSESPGCLAGSVRGSQHAGRPEARASARADSSSATRRAASWSSRVAAGSRSARLTTPLAIAISATTTISSISVKPRARCGSRLHLRCLLPGPDVGVLAFAADHAVGAEAVDIDLALQARVDVLVGPAPGVVGQLVEVGLPVRRDGADGRLGRPAPASPARCSG